MKIHNIKLKNFKTFQDAEISFSTDPDKSITLVIGNNGTGKSTLLDAFYWCFYGVTFFDPKSSPKTLVSIPGFKGIKPLNTLALSVEVELELNNIIYKIFRSKTIQKDNNNEIIVKKGDNIKISFKNSIGATTILQDTDAQNKINLMIPQDIADHFFFDGEGLNKINNNIQGSKNSATFKKSIMKLMGIENLYRALSYLQGESTTKSVYKKIITNIADEDSSIVIDCHKNIIKLEKQYKDFSNQKDKLEQDIRNYKDELKRIREDQQKYAKTSSFIEQKNIRKENLNEQEGYINTRKEEIANTLVSDQFEHIFMYNLCYKVIKKISDNNINLNNNIILSKDLIDQIINSNKCICGSCITENFKSDLKKLSENINDMQYKNNINSYINQTKNIIEIEGNIAENIILNKYEQMQENQKRINEINNEISNLDLEIQNSNLEDVIKENEKKEKNYENLLKGVENKLILISTQIGGTDQKIKSEKKHLDNLITKNNINKTYKRAKLIVEKLRDKIKSQIDEETYIIKDRLEKLMNEELTRILDLDCDIKIKDNFEIERVIGVVTDDYKKSQGQDTVVAITFITSILKLSNEYRDKNSKINFGVETYPFVLDGAFSTLDSHNMKRTCDVLTTASEQVIIFSKDDNSETIINNLSNKIGKQYTLIANNNEGYSTVYNGEY